MPTYLDVFLNSALQKDVQYLNFIADIFELTYKEREKAIKEYAKKFELYNDLGNLISSYSHGMKLMASRQSICSRH